MIHTENSRRRVDLVPPDALVLDESHVKVADAGSSLPGAPLLATFSHIRTVTAERRRRSVRPTTGRNVPTAILSDFWPLMTPADRHPRLALCSLAMRRA
jgi:hypothetical protein